MLADLAYQALGGEGFDGRADLERFHAEVERPRYGKQGGIGVQRRQDEVSGQR